MEANIIGRGVDDSTNFGTLCPLIHPSHRPFCQYPAHWIDVAVMKENSATDHDLASISPSKTLITEGSELSSTLSRCGSPSAYSSSCHPYSADLLRDTEHSSRMNLLCHVVRDIPKHFAVIRDTITSFDMEGSSALGRSMNEKEVSHLIEMQINTPDSMKTSLEDDGGCDNTKAEDVRMQEFYSDNSRCSMMRNCFHCGTTKTPLWRSGPQGPKSLCNACGIRFKKSRKYTDGFESSDIPGSPTSNGLPYKRKQETIRAHSKPSRHQEEMSGIASSKQATLYHRRTARWPALSRKGFENLETTGRSLGRCMTWNLKSPPTPSMERKGFMKGRKGDKSASSSTGTEKHGSITRVFAKDEEEAAVLLMALSCGLVRA